MARSCSLSQAALEASNRMRQVSHWPPGQLSLEDVLRTLDLLVHRTSGLLLLRRKLRWIPANAKKGNLSSEYSQLCSHDSIMRSWKSASFWIREFGNPPVAALVVPLGQMA